MSTSLILTSAVIVCAVTVPATAPAAPATCQGVHVTIRGTVNDDTLRGTRGRDVILGGPGNDTIRGLAGNDLICGGEGDDGLAGGRGDDELQGGSQTSTGDVLRGGAGNDHLVPGLSRRSSQHARDTVSWAGEQAGVSVSVPRGTALSSAGASQHDTLLVEDSTVFILTDHDDKLVSTDRRDFVHPGAGDDMLRTRGGSDRIWFPQDEEADGTDTVRLGGDKDWVLHYGGGLHAWGGPGGDRIEQYGIGENMIDGGVRPDWIRVLVTDAADQRYLGSQGRDRLQVFEEAGQDIDWDMSTGTALRGPDDVPIVMSDFWQTSFRGLGGLLTISGTPRPERIFTRKSATFAGLGGDDQFSGSRFDDTFDGGEGRDLYDEDGHGHDDVNTCISVERDPRNHCSTP